MGYLPFMCGLNITVQLIKEAVKNGAVLNKGVMVRRPIAGVSGLARGPTNETEQTTSPRFSSKSGAYRQIRRTLC